METAERFEGRSSDILFAVAHNLLREHYRAKDKDHRNEELGKFSIEDLGPAPSTVFEAKREEQLLLRALRRIPMKKRSSLSSTTGRS